MSKTRERKRTFQDTNIVKRRGDKGESKRDVIDMGIKHDTGQS